MQSATMEFAAMRFDHPTLGDLVPSVVVLPHTIPPAATIESDSSAIGLNPKRLSTAQPAYEIRLHPAGNPLDSYAVFADEHADFVGCS
ncbi:MAG: hypothetical protein ABJ015_16495, partial [Rhodopirellula bahusiensis]